MEDHNNFYLLKEEPAKSCLMALQGIITRYNPYITEAFKWGLPTFLFKGKIFCFLSVDKKTKHPYILFEGGKYLEHPALEQKNRKWMKSLSINPHEDFQIEIIETILQDALELHRQGIFYVNK